MNSTNITCGAIQANPDVTGLGIRTSVYALSLSSRILALIINTVSSPKDALEFTRAVNNALTMQGLSLLCTAIYETIRKQLTLFHAICTVHLLALLGISIMSKGRYEGLGPIRQAANIFITVIAGAALVAFNGVVWATAPSFGSQPQCNAATVYVVFGVSIYATSPVFRWLILIGFVVGLLGAGPWLVCSWFIRQRRQGIGGATDEDLGPPDGRELMDMLATVAFSIYAIVSLEQTIQRNQVDASEDMWTFGQIMAMFLLLSVANEVLNLVLAGLDRKISRGR